MFVDLEFQITFVKFIENSFFVNIIVLNLHFVLKQEIEYFLCGYKSFYDLVCENDIKSDLKKLINF